MRAFTGHNSILLHWMLPFAALVLCLPSRGQADSPDDDSLGRTIYHQQCASCHGDQGDGSKKHNSPLIGDLPVGDLAKYISENMPEDRPSDCVGEDAKQVAEYIYEQFYSPQARQRQQSQRVQLSRLTVRQYQESVADLVDYFRRPIEWPADRGVNASYYASRRQDKQRKLAEGSETQIDFHNGVPHFDPKDEYSQLKVEKKKAADVAKMAKGFSANWHGSLIANDTGVYTINVQSKNGFRLYLNDNESPLIDRMVGSGGEAEHRATIFLLGGRAYPFKLDFFSYTDPPARIRLSWQPPSGHEQVIPPENFMRSSPKPTLAVATPFPADDESTGYRRGLLVSQQWDEATTAASIEAADWIAENIWELAATSRDAQDRHQKIAAWSQQFVEMAFGQQLASQEIEFFIGQHLSADLLVEEKLQRIVLLTLKSPRFLYPALPQRSAAMQRGRSLALVLWDSIPDRELDTLVRNEQIEGELIYSKQLQRMVNDPRSKAKLQDFFRYWLKIDSVADLTKDRQLFPEFDELMLADLSRSLKFYLDEVVWSPGSDFRELFLADYFYANDRLANFYELDDRADVFSQFGFKKLSVNPAQHAGVLTHPFLMARFAYHQHSSPIHRGVFVARSLLGRTLKQPPDAIKPLDADIDPTLTNRQRVELQTNQAGCMNCHSIINPLGFSLENFDAVGRFRTEENQKPIDASSNYKQPTGETIRLSGPRDLAAFLANDEMAQRSFIVHLFHYYVKQPIDAFGDDCLDNLHHKFVQEGYNIRHLLIEIARISIDQPAKEAQ